jgi:hypothetical protein
MGRFSHTSTAAKKCPENYFPAGEQGLTLSNRKASLAIAFDALFRCSF